MRRVQKDVEKRVDVPKTQHLQFLRRLKYLGAPMQLIQICCLIFMNISLPEPIDALEFFAGDMEVSKAHAAAGRSLDSMTFCVDIDIPINLHACRYRDYTCV